MYSGVFFWKSGVPNTVVITELRQQHKRYRHRQPFIPSGNNPWFDTTWIGDNALEYICIGLWVHPTVGSVASERETRWTDCTVTFKHFLISHFYAFAYNRKWRYIVIRSSSIHPFVQPLFGRPTASDVRFCPLLFCVTQYLCLVDTLMKLTTNICHVSGHCSKGFPG